MKYVGASAKLLLFSVAIFNHIVCTMKITIIIIIGKFIYGAINTRKWTSYRSRLDLLNYVLKFSVGFFLFREQKSLWKNKNKETNLVTTFLNL